jgi:hypothetical protein
LEWGLGRDTTPETVWKELLKYLKDYTGVRGEPPNNQKKYGTSEGNGHFYVSIKHILYAMKQKGNKIPDIDILENGPDKKWEPEYYDYPQFNLFPLHMKSHKSSWENTYQEKTGCKKYGDYLDYCIEKRAGMICPLIKEHSPEHIILLGSSEWWRFFELFKKGEFKVNNYNSTGATLYYKDCKNENRTCRLWIHSNGSGNGWYEKACIGIEIEKSLRK